MRSLFQKLSVAGRLPLLVVAVSLASIDAHAQRFNRALNYDGTDDFTTLPALTAGVTGSFTLETWVYWRGGTNAFPRIFDFGNDGSNFIFLTAAIPFGSTGPRFAIVSGGSVETVDANTTLPINAWSHIAVTLNNTTGDAKIYINGTDVTNAPTTFTLRLSSLGTTTGNWLGGRGQYADPYFNGEIEEFRLSNNVRYTSNFTPPTAAFPPDANTVALYHFDEGTGQSSIDASGNFGAATLGANATSEATDPSWIPPAILPVRLTEFNVIANSASRFVDVKWTASLDEAGSFEVERSADGIRFTAITTISRGAATDGLRNFSFRDVQPLSGRSYYRLKAVEGSRAAVYSRVLPVNLGGRDALLLYPNPVRGHNPIRVELAQPVSGTLTLILRNSSGMTVERQELNANRDRLFTFQRRAALPTGTYTLEALVNGERQTRQLVIE